MQSSPCPDGPNDPRKRRRESAVSLEESGMSTELRRDRAKHFARQYGSFTGDEKSWNCSVCKLVRVHSEAHSFLATSILQERLQVLCGNHKETP